MSKYHGEVKSVERYMGVKDEARVRVTVNVYGELPPSGRVSVSSRNALLMASHKVVEVHGVNGLDWEEIVYRVEDPATGEKFSRVVYDAIAR